jgi:hypothetical protein
MKVLRFILGGLLLPLRLYFKPFAFRAEIAALAPDLPEEFSLWEAREHLRNPVFRFGVYRLVGQLMLSALWIPISVLAFKEFGYAMEWTSRSGVFYWPITLAIAVILGVGVGLIHGVIFLVAFVVIGVVDELLPSGTMAGAIIGGVKVGLVYLVLLKGVGFLRLLSVVVIIVGSGGLIGYVVGVETVQIQLFCVEFVVLFFVVAHVPNLFLQVPMALLFWIFQRRWLWLSKLFWNIHPIRWDDIILIPLPGLAGLLASLYRFNSVAGRAAFVETAAHRYQKHTTFQALAILAGEDAQGIASLPALARYAEALAWLRDDTPLPATLRTQLLALRDISTEVSSAEESDSATNRLRRLDEAKRRLETLSQQPVGGFRPAVSRWAALVEAGIEDARRRQRQEEPIPNAYQWDGKPVRPDGRPDADTPFKGRRALFRRLELALGGADGQRSTYLLIGQRRSGKTSALLQLERRLGAGVIPAFLDLQSEKLGGASDAAGLLHGLAEAVNDEARRRGADLPFLTRRELGADPYPAFGRWLDAVEKKLAGRRLLLCLDEYEALEQGMAAGRFDERLLMALRNIVQHRRRIDVLLSGGRHLDELPPRWAGALVNTLNLPISFLEEDDARELVVRPVADFPANLYSPEAVERILYLSHCQPYLVQVLCGLLVEHLNKSRRLPPEARVEAADVSAVVPSVLERGQAYFSDLWRGQAGGDAAQRILEVLAGRDGLRLSATALEALEPDARARNAALRSLLRREIVGKDGEAFRILVPLVGEYVRSLGVV